MTFLVLASYWFYRAYYFTYYGLGVYSFFDIFLLLIIVTLSWRFVVKVNWQKAWNAGVIAAALLTLGHIAFNHIAKYWPSYDLNIYPQAEGCIYIFVSTLSVEDAPFQVNEYGIGYAPPVGKFDLQFHYRDEDITEYWGHSQFNEIIVYNPDSTQMTAYSVSCFDLKADSVYSTHVPYNFIGCMDKELLFDYIREGWVDTELLCKKVWIRSSKDETWQYNPERSRTGEK